MSKRRKTKEEKIIAELRRKLSSKEDFTATVNTHSEKRSEEVKKIEQSIPAFKIPLQASSKIPTYNYDLVKRDLLKTTALSSLAFSAFVVLYWWLELGGQKLLK